VTAFASLHLNKVSNGPSIVINALDLLDDEAEELELSSLSIGDISALERGLLPSEVAENGERPILGRGDDGPAADEYCIGIAGTGSP